MNFLQKRFVPLEVIIDNFKILLLGKILSDDVTVNAENIKELELSLNELSSASNQKDLKMNMSKTNVFHHKHVNQRQFMVEGNVIEEVRSLCAKFHRYVI